MILAIEHGSFVRGDSDVFSDRDLVLISESPSTLKEKKESYKKLGFSVSTYTFKKSIYLSKNGSLFFKHVIDEGRLLDGEIDSFALITKKWQSRYDYSDQIESNASIFNCLDYVPKNIYGQNSALDIMVTSIRNILVRIFASRGDFIFSWYDLTNVAKKSSLITDKEEKAILLAKSIKNLYRNDLFFKINPHLIEALKNILERISNERIFINHANSSMIDSFLCKQNEKSYNQLRALELLCSSYSMCRGMNYLIKLFKDPNYFGIVGTGTNKAN